MRILIWKIKIRLDFRLIIIDKPAHQEEEEKKRLTYLTLLSDFRDIILKIKFSLELCNEWKKEQTICLDLIIIIDIMKKL
jgi:hypothetical protein